MSSGSAHTISRIAAVLLFSGFCWGQTATLALQPGMTTLGGTAYTAVNLSGGANPAVVGWTFTYTTDVASIAVTDGPATTASSKSVACASSPGRTTCMVSGLNQNAISDGVVANVAVQTAGTASSQILVQVVEVTASTVDATMLAATGLGATIGIVLPQPALAGFACTPTTVMVGTPPACTVTLAGPAPAGGTPISIASTSSVIVFPGIVTVAAGQSSGTFLGTLPATIGADQQSTVTATLGSVSLSVSLLITRPAQLSALACTPTTVSGGAAPTCTATLDKAAGPAAASVALTSSNGNLLVPASVSIAAGAQSATFSASVTPITGPDQQATVTGTLGTSQSVAFTITAPAQLTSLTCSPTAVSVASTPTCTATLDKPAGATAASVTLSSTNANLVVPASVSIAAGAQSATFSASVTAITGADQQATLTGSLGASRSVAFTITAPAQLASLTCSPTTVSGGVAPSCTATLDKPAGATAASVTLSSTNANLAVPASVSIAAGGQSATFSLSVTAITGADQQATLTGTLGASRSVAFTITAPAQLASLACTPTTVSGGAAPSCTATLDKPAGATAISVTLISNNASLVVPASVSIAAGAQLATFAASVTPITGPDQQATLTGTLGASRSVAFTITAPAQLASLTCTPTAVLSGSTTTCTVTLDKAAGSAPASVALVSSSATVTVPSSVSIASGAQSATFAASTVPITGADQQATVTATLGVSQSINLTVSAPAQLAGLACTPTSLMPGASTSCTATLDKAAAGAGATISVASNNPNLPVPATVVIAAGAVSATFTATEAALSGPDQTATITATLAGASKSANVTLSAGPKLAAFSCAADRVFSGASVLCTMSLDSAAATGLSIATASDTPALAVPASVNVAPGSSTAQFTASAGSVAAETTANLTAKLADVSLNTAVTVASAPAFYLRGTTAETLGTANGSLVTPTIAPGGLSAKVVARGGGYLSFDPIQDTDGVTFRLGGAQNANTSFFSLGGAQLGKVFKSAGQLRLKLRSNYSFAERQALPSPNNRYVLDVFDSSGRKFALSVYTQAGRLTIAYNAGSGTVNTFNVPSGQEDALFGKGVVLVVNLAWDRNSASLYLNGQLAAQAGSGGSNLNWNNGASMTIGAQNSMSATSVAGTSALDDVLAELEVR